MQSALGRVAGVIADTLQNISKNPIKTVECISMKHLNVFRRNCRIYTEFMPTKLSKVTGIAEKCHKPIPAHDIAEIG